MSLRVKVVFIFSLLYFAGVSALISEWGRYSYTEYQPGTNGFNLILAAPHGGYKSAGDIPDRRAGCYDYDLKSCYFSVEECFYPNEDKCSVGMRRDSYTQEITVIVADEMQKMTGSRPHVVINHLHRRKLDPNRQEDEAAQGNWNSLLSYNDYHGFIKEAKSRIGGPGLFLDMHGQSHPEAMVELGYDITRTELNSGSYTATDSTVKSLGLRKCGGDNKCFKNIISGAHSLGQYIQNEGYNTVPSSRHKSPGTSPYYNGGYSVEFHGSKSHGGDIDAIQVEIPFILRNQDEGPAFAKDLAKALIKYMDKYYS